MTETVLKQAMKIGVVMVYIYTKKSTDKEVQPTYGKV